MGFALDNHRCFQIEQALDIFGNAFRLQWQALSLVISTLNFGLGVPAIGGASDLNTSFLKVFNGKMWV